MINALKNGVQEEVLNSFYCSTVPLHRLKLLSYVAGKILVRRLAFKMNTSNQFLFWTVTILYNALIQWSTVQPLKISMIEGGLRMRTPLSQCFAMSMWYIYYRRFSKTPVWMIRRRHRNRACTGIHLCFWSLHCVWIHCINLSKNTLFTFRHSSVFLDSFKVS